MTFSVKPDVPIKMDNVVSILSFSPLGRTISNDLWNPAIASAASWICAAFEPYYGIADITSNSRYCSPEAKKLLLRSIKRTTELQETMHASTYA